jgi:hypothetical protein
MRTYGGFPTTTSNFSAPSSHQRIAAADRPLELRQRPRHLPLVSAIEQQRQPGDLDRPRVDVDPMHKISPRSQATFSPATRRTRALCDIPASDQSSAAIRPEEKRPRPARRIDDPQLAASPTSAAPTVLSTI